MESQWPQLAGCPSLGVFNLALAVAMCRDVREAGVGWGNRGKLLGLQPFGVLSPSRVSS